MYIIALAIACSSAFLVAHGTLTSLARDHARPVGVATQPAVLDARAIWLSDRHLAWPGHLTDARSSSARFALFASRSGTITAPIGSPVRNATDTLALSVYTDPLPADLAARFSYLDRGVLLELRETSETQLANLLRGQLVLAKLDASGNVVAATETQAAAALDVLYAAAATVPDLGVRIARTSTRFALWAPTAQSVSLVLHARAERGDSVLLPMQRDDRTGVWRVTRASDLSGSYYTFVVDVYARGAGVIRNQVTDPYSISLSSDSWRSYIGSLDAQALMPAGWRADRTPARVVHPTDLVLYELHVRDFSRDDQSVAARARGKYSAFSSTGSAGVRHLRALSRAGVTDVHLLPVFDLASVPERGCVSPTVGGGPRDSTQQAAIAAVAARDCFNWGYDPLHYTAPEGSYASSVTDGATRVRELRAMVQALHRMGLRVGMDVVYNHTSAAGQAARSILDRIVPGYYHRLDARGNVETSTCCSNTATEHRMMAKLMIESVVTWARDYHLDSFRFDLMGHQPRAVMETLQQRVNAATGRTIHLIGEGWNFGEIADGKRFVQASQLSLNGSGIATFSDRARDAVRGGGAGDNGMDQLRNQGFINGLGYTPNAVAREARSADSLRAALHRSADMVRVGLAGSIRQFTMRTYDDQLLPLERVMYGGNQPAGYVSQPGEVVNYVENHDNQTLFDANVFKLPSGVSTMDRARVQLLGTAIVTLSQGIAYLHAGQEFLRSKSMDRNSFDSGDWFNRIDWTWTTNGFGRGLPPRADNAASWPLMAPLLADRTIDPSAADIAFTRAATLDLLRIRASSTLFRMRTARDITERLTFHNTGRGQTPTVIAAHLRGDGYPGAGFRDVMYFVNVDTLPHQITVPSMAGRGFRLHPVHTNAEAADKLAASATWDPRTGTFTVPARTTVVWVQ